METDKNDMQKLSFVCSKYYDYLNENNRDLSKKKQLKILRDSGLSKNYYPLNEACNRLEIILDNFRDSYR
jgi:hypothetical protein